MCYVIDVSQSVDLDHPLMLDFLRKDCTRLIEFFQKAGQCVSKRRPRHTDELCVTGVPTLTLRELFDFVTDPTVTKENVHRTLDKLLEIAEQYRTPHRF